MENKERTSGAVRAVKIGGLVLILGVLVSLMIFNTPSTTDADAIWDNRTVIGNVEAKNHFVMYTDIMCPYCDYFSRAIMADWDKFLKYLSDNDVNLEMRVTDFLYEYNGVSPMSTAAAEATYCATNQDKFWDYYHATLTALNNDYHSKGIGNSKNSSPILDMPDDYWLNIGHSIGLGEDFDNCVKNHDELEHVQNNTKTTAKNMQKLGQGGLPLFKFNDFVTSGFDPSWDFSYVKQYLDTGLKKK